jgi:hypothetical protein
LLRYQEHELQIRAFTNRQWECIKDVLPGRAPQWGGGRAASLQGRLRRSFFMEQGKKWELLALVMQCFQT